MNHSFTDSSSHTLESIAGRLLTGVHSSGPYSEGHEQQLCDDEMDAVSRRVFRQSELEPVGVRAVCSDVDSHPTRQAS